MRCRLLNNDWQVSLANRWAAALPDDAWAVVPDADEHFHFPCETTLRLMRTPWHTGEVARGTGGATGAAAAAAGHALCARMLERLAPDFSLLPAVASPRAMEARFSLCAATRKPGVEKEGSKRPPLCAPAPYGTPRAVVTVPAPCKPLSRWPM